MSFAEHAHYGQKRRSGEEYMVHPLRVALILAELYADEESIIAGLLHDVVEDTEVTLKDIEDNFGSDVALLVDGLTKLRKLPKGTGWEGAQKENLRKLFLSAAEDPRVIIVKLADRLHNMRTIQYLPPDKQKRVAKETLDVYAPLAHRLGVYRIRWELEDLAFKTLYPEQYEYISALVNQKLKGQKEVIREAKAKIEETLAARGMKGTVEGRVKHLYSVYTKMLTQNKTIDEIFDLVGLRLILDTEEECYVALGLVHSLWPPIPGRLKDYIALPKPNFYQSLHTTVIGPRGLPLEVQIRTWQMHEVAEYGVAAHWAYKEGVSPKSDLERINWLKQVFAFEDEKVKSTDEITRAVMDTLKEEILVFTPKGDVISLPKGATVLDFAYRIHTEIGHHTVGARVNGGWVPLDKELEMGDRVEVVTSKNRSGPSLEWLDFVKTAHAADKINNWFRKRDRQELLEDSRKMLEDPLKKYGLTYQEFIDMLKAKNVNIENAILNLIKNQSSLDSVLKNLGVVVAEPVEETVDTAVATKPALSPNSVIGVPYRLAKCCSPLPPEEIVGIVESGHGIVVHAATCKNVNNASKTIALTWDQLQGSKNKDGYSVDIKITAKDRLGLLADIGSVFAVTGLNIEKVTVQRKQKVEQLKIIVQVKMRNVDDFQMLFNKLSEMPEIIEVTKGKQ
nr:bifunctional (p)ppGpp synthetase/guanosine-3',5'-bis(diphosphate) 3'-pyrophosphohydrolase [Coprothermobacter platensis]